MYVLKIGGRRAPDCLVRFIPRPHPSASGPAPHPLPPAHPCRPPTWRGLRFRSVPLVACGWLSTIRYCTLQPGCGLACIIEMSDWAGECRADLGVTV